MLEMAWKLEKMGNLILYLKIKTLLSRDEGKHKLSDFSNENNK